MHAFAGYAAKCMPHIAVFESVQQAYSGGIDLMRYLREKMEHETGQQWHLYHVKHNAASVGGCAIRRRYFWLVSRVPFGIEKPVVHRVPTLRDAIGDLSGLGDTWEAQPYRLPPSWWAEERGLRSELSCVDGHHIDWTPYTRRGMDLMGDSIIWGPRENISTVAQRYYKRHGKLPDSWAASADKTVASGFNMGYNQLVRWKADGMARVITGGALSLVLHPWEDRPITHREAARIQGFPDDWNIFPLRKVGGLRMTWGKGIPVQCGKWIADWCYRAIVGNPGEYSGEVIGERENLIDCTHSYRTATSEV
jgi:site-specific DNA-cytosine methylase